MKYQYHTRPEPEKREIHPIWRGIGLFMAILTPALAYFATLVLLEQNEAQGWMAIPRDVLVGFGNDPLLVVKIILTIFLSVVIFGVFSLISFILYRSFAPPKLGPYDAPPIRIKTKRYKR
jgi:NADH:ubiquinone oxidoreductase subunit 3 (subunit A)